MLTLDSSTTAKLQAWLVQEQRLFVHQHPQSAQLQTRSNPHYLFGVPMHWMRDWPIPHGLFVQQAQGAELRCVDGHVYADFCLGDTGALFGHSPNEVAQAMADQAARGWTCMLPSQLAVDVGEGLSHVFGLPQWQLALSASDANRFVLRWVRAITGRTVVLVFDGCYHGAVDDSLVDRLDDGRVVDRPSILGQVHSHALTTRVVPFNDLPALAAALADHQVAAVLAEPALTNCGLVLPDPDFWRQAQSLCQRHQTLLVLDETHTLSTACGGWAQQQGLVPDMLVIGKAVAAGLPCAVYGFSDAVAQRMVQAKQQAPEGHSGIGTTLSANMLTMAVLKASLQSLHTPQTYALMLKGAERLEQGLLDGLQRFEQAWTVSRLGARMELQFVATAPRQATQARAAEHPLLQSLLHVFMLNRGMVLTPFHCMMLVSPMTSSAQIDHLLAVFEQFLEMLTQHTLPLKPPPPRRARSAAAPR